MFFVNDNDLVDFLLFVYYLVRGEASFRLADDEFVLNTQFCDRVFRVASHVIKPITGISRSKMKFVRSFACLSDTCECGGFTAVL
jgi:hypothetical protein